VNISPNLHRAENTATMEAQDTGVKPAAEAESQQMSDRDSLSEKRGPDSDGDNKLRPVQTEDIVYPSTAKVAVIMASLYISMFLVALDRTIIATASKSISGVCVGKQRHQCTNNEQSPE
jgi:hypothetical protein